MAAFIVVAGDAVNWFWSFRDFGVKVLSRAYVGDVEAPKVLLDKKTESRVLWGFHSGKDYRDLVDLVREHGVLKVVLVANSVPGVSKRGVIGLGKITEDMLVGAVSWDYWPIPPRAGRRWDLKFYIEVEYAIPELLNNVELLRSFRKEEFRSRFLDPNSNLAKFISKCAPFIVTLIPSNVTQGSKFVIREEEYRMLRDLALKRWGIVRVRPTGLSRLELNSVLNEAEKYGLYYSVDVLAAAVAALRSGKHLLLMGAPATGKSMLARVLADSLGFELYACTASSAWTRYDFIGGPVLGENGRLEWRCGHLLRALARHLELKEEENRGVLLLVEELNRAEADKVLAEFFTMFPSSNPEEWRFPEGLIREIKSFEKEGKAVDEDADKLLKYFEENKDRRIPEDFRIVATVNTFDRAFLFTLGYALQRRFVVLEILPPESREKELEAVIAQLKRKGITIDEKAKKVAAETVDLIRALREATGRPLGTGISVDTAILAYEMLKSGGISDIKEAVQKAASFIALPQLELIGEEVKRIIEKLKDYNIVVEEIKRIGVLRGS